MAAGARSAHGLFTLQAPPQPSARAPVAEWNKKSRCLDTMRPAWSNERGEKGSWAGKNRDDAAAAGSGGRRKGVRGKKEWKISFNGGIDKKIPARFFFFYPSNPTGVATNRPEEEWAKERWRRSASNGRASGRGKRRIGMGIVWPLRGSGKSAADRRTNGRSGEGGRTRCQDETYIAAG